MPDKDPFDGAREHFENLSELQTRQDFYGLGHLLVSKRRYQDLRRILSAAVEIVPDVLVPWSKGESARL